MKRNSQQALEEFEAWLKGQGFSRSANEENTLVTFDEEPTTEQIRVILDYDKRSVKVDGLSAGNEVDWSFSFDAAGPLHTIIAAIEAIGRR